MSDYNFPQPPRYTWNCELFGMGTALVITLPEGKQPCAFWRWMQWLAFGNKWSRIADGVKE